MGRAPCCDKSNVKRGPWSPEEDAALKNYLHNNGTGGNWISLPQRAGLRRCGKSCRLRWLNYLRPDIKHGAFTEEEDNIIISMYYKMGSSRWSVIAANLSGRTDNDVKNHWNTKLKKKLLGGTSNNINKFNPVINPKTNTHVTFINNNISNPISQTPTSSSTSPTPSYVDNNHNNYDHISTNQVHNHQIYVPNPSFSDLLAHCTTRNSMSLLPNFATNVDHAYHAYDPINILGSTQYPFHHALMMPQTSSALTNAYNANVCPHEEVSSTSRSLSIVYGSNFEDDPFLAELGFGLMQEGVMMNNPACNVDVDQEDIKPQGLGQGVAN